MEGIAHLVRWFVIMYHDFLMVIKQPEGITEILVFLS